MTFPAMWTVRLHPRSVGATKDAHGNPVESWDIDGIVEPVFAWYPAGADSVPFEPGRTPVERDLVVLAPASAAQPRDRMTVGGVVYEVVGWPEDFTHGPFGFRPGVRVSLRRVEEAG